MMNTAEIGLVRNSAPPFVEPANPLLVYISSCGERMNAIRNGRLLMPNISISIPSTQLPRQTNSPKNVCVDMNAPVRAMTTMKLYR